MSGSEQGKNVLLSETTNSRGMPSRLTTFRACFFISYPSIRSAAHAALTQINKINFATITCRALANTSHPPFKIVTAPGRREEKLLNFEITESEELCFLSSLILKKTSFPVRSWAIIRSLFCMPSAEP
jgi:hypothetical protein